ncbi:MAG: hypothetical protein L0211_16275 [Planctomycetaceae bacterium]|nr:hypothetical protein [Planctomycetaceae bacterium]
MRFAMLLALGLALGVPAATPADDKKDAPLSKDSYVKVRVEVELRGILRDTDKGATVTTRDQLYNLFNDAEEITRPSRGTVYALDFARAKDLRELAKVLSGKEVVVVGMSELRKVIEITPMGGETGAGSPHPPPTPTWSLQRTVLVTGLKSAGDK